MTKPVDEEEMILRIAALLRRSRIVSERRLSVGSTVLYYDSLTVRTDGEPVGAAGGMELPQKEFLLLHRISACVPFPAPGAPSKIIFKNILLSETDFFCFLGTPF